MKVKFYFCYCGRSIETEVINRCKPPNLLLSYFFFKNKTIKEIKEKLGYNPNVFLDCGAFQGEVDVKRYLKYVRDNESEIEKYMSVDVMGDGEQSYQNFLDMKTLGYNPVPVFHYKTDEKYLDKYYEMGERFIALGSTVPELKKTIIRMWINELAVKYPDVDFHILGTSRRVIIDNCPILSCDSSGWIRTAALKGKDREHRMKMAIDLMTKTMLFTR